MRVTTLAMTLTGLLVVVVGLAVWEPPLMVAGALGIIISQTIREGLRA